MTLNTPVLRDKDAGIRTGFYMWLVTNRLWLTGVTDDVIKIQVEPLPSNWEPI